jgi:hypothetical protein
MNSIASLSFLPVEFLKLFTEFPIILESKIGLLSAADPRRLLYGNGDGMGRKKGKRARQVHRQK